MLTPHDAVIYFDRSNPVSFLNILERLGNQNRQDHSSILIHTQGTRSKTCREETSKISRRTVQMAIQANIPIVPIRFIGGLPIQEAEESFQFPLGYGTQNIYVGSPIYPKKLNI